MLRRIFVLLLVLALVLTGCASDSDRQEGGADTGPVVPTEPVRSAEENTPEPGAPLPTQGDGGQAAQTPGTAATPQAVEAPFLASSITGSEVAGQAGRYGIINGIVVDAAAGRGLYLVVENIGAEVQKNVLLPWGAFQLVLLAPDQAAQSPGTFEPVIWLTVDDGIVAQAPEVDAAALSSSEQREADWDAESRQYWTGKVPEMPVTGENPAGGGQNVLYLSGGDIEYSVRNEAGEETGQLENMVFQPDGSISFAVVEFASLLDLGEQLVVVPWRLLGWSGEEQAFTLNASEDELQNAPRFDESALPDMTIPGWDQEWQRYWERGGQRAPARTISAGSSQVQVSRLMGSPVMDVNEELLGQVADIILGENGAINYLVVQGDDKLRPVPWADFEIGAAQDSLLYLDDVQRYLDAPAFAALDQINASVPGWDEQIRGYWGLGR